METLKDKLHKIATPIKEQREKIKRQEKHNQAKAWLEKNNHVVDIIIKQLEKQANNGYLHWCLCEGQTVDGHEVDWEAVRYYFKKENIEVKERVANSGFYYLDFYW